MRIYNSADDTITYRIDLKWMKRKMIFIVAGYGYDKIPDNGWYPIIEENYDMFISKKLRKTRISATNRFRYKNTINMVQKILPDICIKRYDYLVVFLDNDIFINMPYCESYFKKCNKHTYCDAFEIKLGIRDTECCK